MKVVLANYWRKVEPYILAIKDKGEGNIFFTGYAYPSKERKIKSTNDNQGQYLLNKIDIDNFEVLDELYKISYEKIYDELRTIKIICRVDLIRKTSSNLTAKRRQIFMSKKINYSA